MDRVKDILTLAVPNRVDGLPPAPQTTVQCQICKDAGYLRPNVPYGHPQFGKAQMCECKKAEIKAKQQQALLEISGVVGLAASFETFKSHLPGCRTANRQAVNYAHNPDGWFVLLGPYGCGKTHLAVSIAKVRVECGATVLVQTVPDLLDHLRSGFSPNAEQDFSAKFEQMRNVDLLVLDDYGAQHNTDWATEKLFQLFNYRYTKNLSTVVTSNNIELVGIDERIYSRLHDTELVTMVKMSQARDYRIYRDRQE